MIESNIMDGWVTKIWIYVGKVKITLGTIPNAAVNVNSVDANSMSN
jgi:hypothetical protein